MKKLAAAPAWLVFLAFIALPLLSHKLVALCANQFTLSGANASIIVLFLSAVLPGVWWLCQGFVLHKSIDLTHKPSLAALAVFSLILPVAMRLSGILFWKTLGSGEYALLFSILVGVVTVGSFVYVMYFLSKCLVIAEKRLDIIFMDYFETFLLFLFYPVGIWWLQPRVKKVLTDNRP